MSDRFRFRAWEEVGRVRRMVYFCIKDHWEGEIYPEDDSTPMLLPKDSEIMQSTGLKDRNGKLIYEGDVVEVSVLNGQFTGVFVVEYHDNSFLMCKPGHNKGGIDQAWYYDATVIGNIYENPELVGGSTRIDK